MDVSPFDGLLVLKSHDPELYQQAAALDAVWFSDASGVAHGRPSHAGEKSAVHRGRLGSLLSSQLCLSRPCGSMYRFAGSEAVALARKGQVVARVLPQLAHIRRDVEHDPLSALTQCRLLRRQLLSALGPDGWELGAQLVDEVEKLDREACEKLLTPERREADRDWATAAYLHAVDLGPLHDLRMLLDSALESERAALSALVAECDGSVEWAAQAEECIRGLASTATWPTPHYLDQLDCSTVVQHLSEQKSARVALHMAWAQDAVSAVQATPAWWDGAWDYLTFSSVESLALVGADEPLDGDAARWEAYRLDPDSPLLALPYSAGRLFQVTHDVPVAVTDTRLNEAALDICHTLLRDSNTVRSSTQLDSLVATALLLSQETPKKSDY